MTENKANILIEEENKILRHKIFEIFDKFCNIINEDTKKAGFNCSIWFEGSSLFVRWESPDSLEEGKEFKREAATQTEQNFINKIKAYFLDLFFYLNE